MWIRIFYKISLSGVYLVIHRQAPVGQILIAPLLEEGEEALEALLTEQDPGVAANKGRPHRELDSHLGDIHLEMITESKTDFTKAKQSIKYCDFPTSLSFSSFDWPVQPTSANSVRDIFLKWTSDK